MNSLKYLVRSKKIRKFYKILETFDLSLIDDNDNFTSVAEKIANKSLIYTLNRFFSYLFSLHNKSHINARIFLSTFMIITDIESVSSTPNPNILNMAKELITSFYTLKLISRNNPKFVEFYGEQFVTKLHDFNAEFKSWREADLNTLLEVLFISYYQIQDMLNNINEIDDSDGSPYKALSNEGFKEQLTEIEKSILRLDPNNGLRKLQEYQPQTQKVAVSNDIYEVAEKAYWDSLTEDLKQNPPNFDMVLRLLEEITQKLKDLTPNRPDKQVLIDQSMDLPYIKQMVDHQVFGPNELHLIVNFIFDKIKEYESPERNNETQEILDGFNRSAKNGDNLEYHVILPVLFKKFYTKLDEILEDTKQFLNNMEESGGEMDL